VSQFKVDAITGDLVRENGSFVRVTGREEIAQHSRVRLRLFRFEVPFNLALGLNYVGIVLAKGTPVGDIEGEFRVQLLDTPGIVEVDRINLSQTALQRQRREGVIDFVAKTDEDDLAARTPLHDRITIPIAVTPETT